MMKLMFAMILAFAVLLVSVHAGDAPKRPFGADKRLEKVPMEVLQAEKTLTKWLDGFNDQSSDKVRKDLGTPTKETVWLFEQKKELLLKYKIGDSTELSLYFHQGRVVKVGLHLLP